MGPNVVNDNKFFIDDFVIKIHTRRNQGRSKKGDRVYRRVSGQRGPNITVCIAVSNRQGLVHYQVFAGGMTAEKFSRFLEVLSGNDILADMNAFGIYASAFMLMLDLIRISDLCVPGNLTVRRLPKNSPFLNMAGNAISCWKQAIKRSLASRKDEFISQERY